MGSSTKPKSESVLTGLFKAVAFDNKAAHIPGIDGKFKFNADGTFTFMRKTLTDTLWTKGTYEMDGDKLKLTPDGKSVWPEFWPNPALVTISSNGELQMYGLDYEPSIIGKSFDPGYYQCDKNPKVHYYFDRNGGYKYTGQGMSTGEYWAEKEIDPDTKAERVFLILNILRVDGKRCNFHQRIDIEADGTFTMEHKFKYKKAEVVESAQASRPAQTATGHKTP